MTDHLNRNEFFDELWKKRLKPIVLLVAIILGIFFFVDVFAENGKARFIVLLVLGIGIFFLAMNLIGILFSNVLARIYARLSQQQKNGLKILGKVFSYLTPFVLGAIAYHAWSQDKTFVVVIMGYLIIKQIIEIIKNEKLIISPTDAH